MSPVKSDIVFDNSWHNFWQFSVKGCWRCLLEALWLSFTQVDPKYVLLRKNTSKSSQNEFYLLAMLSDAKQFCMENGLFCNDPKFSDR